MEFIIDSFSKNNFCFWKFDWMIGEFEYRNIAITRFFESLSSRLGGSQNFSIFTAWN